mgnify:CR=1 FL=1
MKPHADPAPSRAADSLNTARQAERDHLDWVQQRLAKAVEDAQARLNHHAREIQDQKRYLWESRSDMDHVEKVSSRESIEQMTLAGEAVLRLNKRLLRIQPAPYFGRIDFSRGDQGRAEPIYIGIHQFHDDDHRRALIHDWRAPIASLFYDFETGPVRYQAPEGAIDGQVTLKRQFRIRHGRIELMLDTAVNVVDDILQEELGRATDEGMKNIVATIQRDQNAIIRNDQAPVLIIQGVAGSGKTSIALHRIAYLLYRFKDTLSSKDILIISPNRVFGDYIGNVLPELGEEQVNEIGMETLAEQLLDSRYRFQSFFEQTAALAETRDEALAARIRRKASREFLRALDAYVAHVEQSRFQAGDVWIARRLMPGWLLEELFRKHRSLGTTERINQVVREAEQRIGIEYHYDLQPEERRALRDAVRGMVNQSTLRETYKQFFTWLGEPELFRPAGGRLEYADVFPLIYLKMRLEGIRSPYRGVKHLLVDEMQDYTPVQYAVLARLFPCNKTILGDAHQSINPHASSKADEIREAFNTGSCVTLNTSYRSSYEIAQFARRISPNPDLVAVERHGEAPQVIRCRSRREELARVADYAEALAESGHNTLGIICRTPKQARRLAKALDERGINAHLFDERSQSYSTGVIVCTAHMAKGLEFDQVVVPEAGAGSYHSPMDRNLLYVACTRAMHRLVLTHTGEVTPFLQ